MKIPSKIYIRKVHLEHLAENDCMLGANLPAGKKPFPMEEDKCVEYTNLSSVWHDARKEKHLEGVCGNNPVVVVGLRNGRISNRYLWEDMEDCWLDIEVLADCKTYDKALWAYLRDLVPGVKPKGL